MFERILAEGVEKKVYEDPDNPERVVKIYNYESSSLPEVKSRYHFGKLLHILFPDNFPDIHLSGQKNDKTATIIAEKRERDSDHARMSELLNKPEALNKEEKDEYDNIITRQESAGLGHDIVQKLGSLGVKFDTLARNFSRQESGQDVYLDTINTWVYLRPTDTDGLPDLNQKKYLALNFDELALTTQIEKLVGENQKRQAYMHLERIKALAEQERTEKNSGAWGPF